ncbi:MAG: OmpH family outer membrane protein [Saprospiraceae bacterium]|uniref:OmpH family outer membrane protein n=1 Tax=Candidatus Defluviibacterium haderslevense TaxID=2981993 RepID=A0A9D7XGD7_9BACT|nr:OmpH family outer membrane protein [Candidatus Defluviibacterium haderslevense]MBL0235985.1 OmpH family outer membrane protein [Candidatus Defluviibacterium haderslevense]
MMKNISWVLHGLSIIGIILLWMQNNGLKKSLAVHDNPSSSISNENQSTSTQYPIAYFSSDSLLTQLGFFKESESGFKKKQESMMNELKNRETSLQKEAVKLQESAPNMTRNELENGQMKLAKMEQELMARKENMANQFAEETAEFNEKLHQKITSYLKELNTDNRYKFIFSVSREGNIFYADSALDITPIMVLALNEKYSK